MIRKAIPNDIDRIMAIVKDILVEMKIIRNYQWDDDYPAKDVFLNDIAQGNLYVSISEEQVLEGFVCIDSNQPEAYRSLSWDTPENALVIHRMGVSVKARGKGVGKNFFELAESLAASKGISAMRSDTYATNKTMNALFLKRGYRHVGEFEMRDKPLKFQCYEKKL